MNLSGGGHIMKLVHNILPNMGKPFDENNENRIDDFRWRESYK